MLRLQSAFKIFGHSSGRSRNAQVLHHASLERRLSSGSTELPKNARNVPTNSRILPRFRLIERTSLDLLSENRGFSLLQIVTSRTPKGDGRMQASLVGHKCRV